MRFTIGLMGCALLLSAPAARAQQGQPEQHVRGDVVSLEGEALEVRTRPGETVHLTLPEQAKVAQVVEARPDAIADGAFVGTTAVRQPDGTLRALEVHVFPESMRGAGEGHRPWDLGPGSSMTNATVSGMARGGGAGARGTGSSMTNATVSGVKEQGGTRTLTLRYAGGEQTVVVPPGIPIVKIQPGSRSLLVPGAHVVAFAAPQPDGKLVAQRITVGEDGVVPPM